MTSKDIHSEALLGIHLGQTSTRPIGSPPSDEELALLIEGKLGEERRLEVLSHLSHRKDRYQQWLSLAAMNDLQTSRSSLGQVLLNAMNNWLVDWRYAAAGIGAMAFTLLLVSRMSLPPEPAGMSLEATAVFQDAAPASNEDLADSAAREVALEQQEVRAQKSQGAMMPRAERSLMAQSAPAPATEPAPEPLACQSLQHRDSKQQGALCVIPEQAHFAWVWQADTGESLRLGELTRAPVRFGVSPSQDWLAFQTEELLVVTAMGDFWSGQPSYKTLPFDAGTTTFSWEEDILVISVLRDLGDSDDDHRYRYWPVEDRLEEALP